MKKKASKTKKQSKRILKNIKFVPPEAIKPYKKNPRVNEMAVPEVEQSIDEFDFLQPVVVDKKGEIIVGHTRWLAAIKSELPEIPVIYATHLTPNLIETKGGCKGSIGKGLKKQGKSIEKIADFNPESFLEIINCSFKKKYVNSYVFCNKDLLPNYLSWASKNKISFNVLVWKKPNAIPIGGSHYPDIEYLLLFRLNAIWNGGLKKANYSRCLIYDRDLSKDHPTVKPVDLIENQLRISSKKDSGILDFYLGSGSTLIACENSNRKCYGLELDPIYIDVIIKRWEGYTGNKAIKVK